jgi:hypothetical protein
MYHMTKATHGSKMYWVSQGAHLRILTTTEAYQCYQSQQINFWFHLLFLNWTPLSISLFRMQTLSLLIS